MGGDNLVESIFVNVADEKFKARGHRLESIHIAAFADQRCQETGVEPGLCPQVEAAHTPPYQSFDKGAASGLIQPQAHSHAHLSVAAVEPETKTVALGHEQAVRREKSTGALIFR